MPKLNPNEAPEGYVALDAGPDNACLACDLYATRECRSDLCCSCDRQDEHSVVFKRKPTKPVRKPREWMAWAVIWRNKEDNEPSVYCNRKWARGNCGPEGKVIRVKITEVV